MHVPSPSSRSRQRIYLSLWDLFWAVASPLLALHLRDPGILFRPDWPPVVEYWLLSVGFAVVAFYAFKIQDNITRHFSAHEAIDIVETVLFVELMTFISLFALNRFDGIPRSIPLSHGVLLAAGLFAMRILFRIVSPENDPPREYRLCGDRMILIGATPVASSFIRLLNACAPDRQHVIAVLDGDRNMIGRAISGVQVVGRPLDLEAIVKEYAIHGVTANRVVVAGEVDCLTPVVLREIEHICQRHRITLSFLPRMIGLTDQDKVTGAALSGPELTKPSIALPPYQRLKRFIDVMGSVALLLFLSPLFILVAGLVALDVGRPVLFWQERLGWKGRAFLIYKFRTLAAPFDSDSNPLQGKRQPSAIGRMLRATRFDELPQLLNVLFGDMSLIGPRPLLPEDQPANTAMRLLVRPGITGWAQVSGGKLISKEEKQRLDEWYIRNAALWLDFQIAIMTLKIVLMRRRQDAEADAEQVQRKNLPLTRQHQDAEPDPEQVQRKHLLSSETKCNTPADLISAG
jgi:lipopolysaccharide/colanic/teichoic acid biosynthesis glycosyltransferase